MKNMKMGTVLMLTALLAVSAPACSAPTSKNAAQKPAKLVTGADWLLMSSQERTDYMISAMKFLQEQGIPFRRPAAYYVAVANEVVAMPGNDKVPVINILTTTVYKEDPRAHAVLDKLTSDKKKS